MPNHNHRSHILRREYLFEINNHTEIVTILNEIVNNAAIKEVQVHTIFIFSITTFYDSSRDM